MDSQIDALKKYVSDQGYIMVGIYNDAGISARKKYSKRPALLQLMEDCKSKKVDLIIFTKLDRWFRSVADYYEVQSILDDCKVPWRAIWEDYETETSAGVFKVNIMLSIAQAEADRTSERLKAVNAYRRANGQYIAGKAPIGYKSVQSQIIIDQDKKEAVASAFNIYLQTTSVRDFQNELKINGIVIRYDSCRNILQNPTYKGDAYGVPCEPYITPDQWDYIQYVFSSRRTRAGNTPKRIYLFSGLIRCSECGYTFNSRICTSRYKDKKYPYKFYKCRSYLNGTCSNGVTLSEKYMEQKMLEILKPEMDKVVYDVKSRPKDTVNYEKERKILEGRVSRIGDRYELGEISRDEYIEKVTELKSKIADLKPVSQKKVEHLPDNWREMYDKLDEKHKQNFWKTSVKYITANKEKDIKPYFFA